MEEKKISKTKNNALWLLVGLPVVAVLILLGMLVYDNYLDNKAESNNLTEEKELEETGKDVVDKNENNATDDKNQTENNIDLKEYVEVDISKQNIFPIYKRYEKTESEFYIDDDKSYTGSFIIENNKLYFQINGNKKLINVPNPKKVVIGSYGQDPGITLFVLTSDGNIYWFSCYTLYEFNNPQSSNTDILSIVNTITNYINANISINQEYSNISDISAIMSLGGVDWEDVYFTYTKEGKEMITRVSFTSDGPDQEIGSLKVDLGPVTVKNDKSVYDFDGNKLDIKVKYLLHYIPETGHGAFLDEDNYLYVSIYKENENIKKGKVKKVYKSNNIYGDILVLFEDGTYKKLSEYYDR